MAGNSSGAPVNISVIRPYKATTRCMYRRIRFARALARARNVRGVWFVQADSAVTVERKEVRDAA